LLQASCEVHTSPSLHGPALATCQQPVAGVQPSSVQTFRSSQLVGGPDVHAPDWQVSFDVQASASEQLAPFAFAGFEQIPVDVLHVPTRWH
jgi:hypothetical protein